MNMILFYALLFLPLSWLENQPHITIQITLYPYEDPEMTDKLSVKLKTFVLP